MVYQAKCRNGPAGLQKRYVFDRVGMRFAAGKTAKTHEL
jgi:hypothetical protein